MRLFLKIQLAWYLIKMPAFPRERTVVALKAVKKMHGIHFGEKALTFSLPPYYPCLETAGDKLSRRLQEVRYSDIVYCGDRGDGIIEIITRRFTVHYLGVYDPARVVLMLARLRPKKA